MAREDDALPVQSGILDPLVGMGFFSPNMSLEEIKRRRAIGAALASRARPFPKTIGEGMTALGEALGERWAEDRLAAAEKGYLAKRDADMPGAVPIAAPVPRPVAEALPEVAPPAVAAAAPAPAPAIARPSPLPPAPAGPMPAAPGVGNRADIARVLAMRNPAMADMIAQIGGQGTPPPAPMVTANAALNTGAAPAGPAPDSATFAEEGPNPPTISRDIKPMLVAEAAGPRPTAPPFGLRGPDISVRKPITRPPEPEMEPAGKDERAWEAYRQKYSNDPDVVNKADRAIEPYKQKRLQDYSEKRKEWELKFGDYLKQEADERAYERGLPQAQQTFDEKQLEIEKKKEEAATRARLGGIPETEFLAGLKEGTKETKNILGATASLRGIQKELDAGNMFTGQFADVELAKAKAWAGLGGQPNPKIVPTEKFQALVATITAQARQMLAGGANISDKDLEKAETAAGGNIKLEADSIKEIMGSLERLNAQMAVAQHRKIKTYTGDDPVRQEKTYGLYGVPNMEQVVPQAAVKDLRGALAAEPSNRAAIMKEFDDDFHTPGLAARVLGSRR